MKKRKYSIGLDIGVASVGWACMTPDFNFMKYNGKYTLGVHEFESAETAEERRIKRGGRRRYNRRIKRIQLLQKVLAPLFKEDSNYLHILNENDGHFWKNSNRFENRSLSEALKSLGRNTREYPTIYHLRKDLVESTTKFDPKLIYLALHNLTKYRGHFLSERKSWGSNEQSESPFSLLKNLFTLQSIALDIPNIPSDSEIEELIHIYEMSDSTRSDKLKLITEIAGREYNQLNRLLLGMKTNMHLLFPASENVEAYKEEKHALILGADAFEEIQSYLLDDEQLILAEADKLFQVFSLQELLGNARYVAEAKVASFDQFGEDLKELKAIYNDVYGRKDYREMFITSRANNTKYEKTRDKNLLCKFDQFLKHAKDFEDKFYNDLKKKFESTVKKKDVALNVEEKLVEIIHKIEEGDFLQKQKSKLNASIPHQNNIYEAQQILKQQQPFYPEITDEMIKKIGQIIGFRIPYYIGPLVREKDAPFGWLERKDDMEAITPWNFEEVVDKSKSAEKFIVQMTGYCTYLTDEKVLPKNSLLYQKFEVLNELNGVQIRKSNEIANRKYRLAMEEKNWILKHIFQKYKSVTHTRLKNELKKSPYKELIIDEETDGLKGVYGTQQENKFATNMSSYIDMERIFGDLTQVDLKMLEEIIYWLTIFTESEIIEMKIKEKYPTVTNEQINQLTKLNYSGWGRLSKKLLDGIRLSGTNYETVIETMHREGQLFMEVLHEEKYKLEEKIKNENKKEQLSATKIKYKDIAELQGSPALKRGIWRAILIVEELVSIFGEPEHIMLEFAREDGEKRRTKSRAELWKDSAASISAKEKDLKQFANLHTKHPDMKYQNDRFFLYLSQQGKCLYSGEELDLNQLSNYEVDHILPRSFVKDDSIDNLALVKKKMNQEKQELKMPLELIPLNKRAERIMFWKRLYENNMISGKKYHLLLKERFTDLDKESFFARQLVETRQITKHVSLLLEERFENTEIHPLKAGFISKFRSHVGVSKIRNYNNKHHAVDAAIGLLLIQFIVKKYGRNFLKFDFQHDEVRKKWGQLFTQYDKNFFLFSQIDKYESFPNYEQAKQSISARQYLTVLNHEIPWQSTKKVGSNESAFYDETIYSPKETKGRNPRYQSSKLSKGVHSGMKVDRSYFVSYSYYNKQKKEMKRNNLVDLFVIEKHQLKNLSDKELAIYLAEKDFGGKVIDAEIRTEILKHQLVLSNGHPFYFVSSGELHNAQQFKIEKELLDDYLALSKVKAINFEEQLPHAKVVFNAIGELAIEQYAHILSERNIANIREYATASIVDKEAFLKGVDDLFSMASASAARTAKFGGRVARKLNLSMASIVYQSVTGLRYRKPKSFQKELW